VEIYAVANKKDEENYKKNEIRNGEKQGFSVHYTDWKSEISHQI
jgi:hypothetical protein